MKWMLLALLWPAIALAQADPARRFTEAGYPSGTMVVYDLRRKDRRVLAQRRSAHLRETAGRSAGASVQKRSAVLAAGDGYCEKDPHHRADAAVHAALQDGLGEGRHAADRLVGGMDRAIGWERLLFCDEYRD